MSSAPSMAPSAPLQYSIHHSPSDASAPRQPRSPARPSRVRDGTTLHGMPAATLLAPFLRQGADGIYLAERHPPRVMHTAQPQRCPRLARAMHQAWRLTHHDFTPSGPSVFSGVVHPEPSRVRDSTTMHGPPPTPRSTPPRLLSLFPLSPLSPHSSADPLVSFTQLGSVRGPAPYACHGLVTRLRLTTPPGGVTGWAPHDKAFP